MVTKNAKWIAGKQVQQNDGMSLGNLQEIFAITNCEEGMGNTLNPDNEFTANEFVESIVRLACSRQWCDECKTIDATTPCYKRLEALMRAKVLKHATRSDVENWRHSMKNSEIKDCFYKNRVQLESMYLEFGGDDDNKLMSFSEMTKMLRTKRVFDTSFTDLELADLFSKIQQDEDKMLSATEDDVTGANVGIEDVDRGGESELTYQEFLEGLAAIAIFKDPDPYIPMGTKVQRFVEHSILRVSKKKRRAGVDGGNRVKQKSLSKQMKPAMPPS